MPEKDDEMEAEEAIRRTLARYVHRWDDKDIGGVVELFTEDGLLVASAGEAKGREGIREFLTRSVSNAPVGRKSKHLHESSVILIDGDTATATSDLVVFQAFGSAPWSIQSTNRHADKLVLREGEWRFTEKRIVDAQSFVSNRPLAQGGA
jgi:uncharacterized protein (TIGR02246 family)